LAQDWIATSCSEFIGKSECPPNSPDVNPLDYHVWRVIYMLEHYTRHFISSKRTLTQESLAVNMEPAATGLDQQGDTELRKKRRARV